MVDYCTLAQVKRSLSTTNSTNPNYGATDTLLEEMITESSREIDDYCKRHFYESYATRNYDAIYPRVDLQTLYLDEDLLALGTIANGNGDVIPNGSVVLYPANESPKYAIRVLPNTTWQYTTNWEQAISVEGTWGFNTGTTAPANIQRACIRLVTWRFKQRDAPFETVAFPEVGAVSVPSAMPEDVARMLDNYRRIESVAIQRSSYRW